MNYIYKVVHMLVFQAHTSWQVFITTAILEIRSAACWRTLADLLFRRHRIVPQICGRYGFTRLPRALTTVPNPFSITISCTQQYRNKCLMYEPAFIQLYSYSFPLSCLLTLLPMSVSHHSRTVSLLLAVNSSSALLLCWNLPKKFSVNGFARNGRMPEPKSTTSLIATSK